MLGGSTGGSGRKRRLAVPLWVAAFVGLVLIESANFLLFHSLVEIFSVVVASAVFIVAWNSRRRLETDFLLIVGVAYAVVAVFDTLHMLSYPGMSVFRTGGADLSTQLWIAARYVEAGSLVVASLFVGPDPLGGRFSFGRRRRDTAFLVGGYVALTGLLLAAILGGVFPTTYADGGLTPFKIYSEYAVVGLLSVALAQLYRHRQAFDRRVYSYLTAGTLLTIGGELFFTVYVSVYGLSTVAGHFLKIASFYLIYLAVVKTAISDPQDVLFRQLQQERNRLANREEQLARKNRRLDQFASIVSHDLRNPLNVAAGRIELARTDPDDDDHLSAAVAAIDRMERLIDDVLALAREGKTVDETEPVEIAPLARTCWESVHTGGAGLRVETDRTVRADERRLRQVFENLFRNAVEHGGEDVTVTVGSLADGGFYVEDDGPGLPADSREAVFEPGYSTATDGTGFGLNIVREIVQAHGWEIEAREAAGGGARFEITGVDAADAVAAGAGRGVDGTT